MAIFYQGYRPVTKGRNSNDSVHPYKGVGEYSNYDLWNTSHVLDGAPNTDHTPGTGYHPGDYYLSSIMTGAQTYVMPLSDPGTGAALTWYTLLSDLIGKQGEDGQAAMGSGFGHEYEEKRFINGYTEYLDDIGEAKTFDSLINKGVTVAIDPDAGTEVATPTNVWNGVTSAQILSKRATGPPEP